MIGQSSFTGGGSGYDFDGAERSRWPRLRLGRNLWVVDTGNSRVLEYKTPFSTGEAASLVIGQSSFTSSDFADTNSTGLSYPTGLAFDSGGNLWVADQGNDRVLEYKAPFSTHEAASLVIGQPSFTSREYGRDHCDESEWGQSPRVRLGRQPLGSGLQTKQSPGIHVPILNARSCEPGDRPVELHIERVRVHLYLCGHFDKSV